MYKKNENLLEIRIVGLLICYIGNSICVLKFDSFMQKLKYLKPLPFFGMLALTAFFLLALESKNDPLIIT